MIDEKQMRQRIETECPSLKIGKIVFNHEGQNNSCAMVNDEWVFRFPKYIHVIPEARLEYELLTRIRGRFNLLIPDPCWASFAREEVGAVFMAYRLIPGVPLSRERLRACPNSRQAAIDLGQFLHQLHETNPQELLGINLPRRDTYERWSRLYERIAAQLFPHMPDEMRLRVAHSFASFLGDGALLAHPVKLIHGDLGGSNILYDESQHRVSGIIDFSSIQWGDPAGDLAALALGPFGYGMKFLEDMAEAYPVGEGAFTRARFYASTFPLQYALFGAEHDRPDALRDGLESYQLHMR